MFTNRVTRSRALRLLTTLPALAAVAAVTAGPATASTAPLVPQSGTLFGAFVNDPSTGSGAEQQVNNLENGIGRKLAIHQIFLLKGKLLNKMATWDVTNGRTPLITFGSGYNTVDVANGNFDSYFGQLADQIAALQHPVFLRFDHEMDAAANAGYVISASDFIAAYRHVHALFAAHGVTTSAWVWEPTGFGFKPHGNLPAPAPAYYPGDDVVDWIGADAYNWGGCRSGFKYSWRDFSDLVSPFYAWGSAKGKPMIVPEFGTVESNTDPNAKAAWYNSAASELQTQFPQIRAVVYFDAFDGRGDQPRACDWTPATSTTSFNGFKSMATMLNGSVR